jgi:hypothetical protein
VRSCRTDGRYLHHRDDGDQQVAELMEGLLLLVTGRRSRQKFVT